VAAWLPTATDVRELARPWKLVTFGISMTWLLYGALSYGIADWDVGVTLIMGGLTYLLAPWTVRTIFDAVRNRRRDSVLRIAAALAVAWFVVDGVYVAYHTIVGNTMFRIENFRASSAIYLLAGCFWLYRGSVRDFVADVRRASRAA
jgi:uncharacterized protein YjeT (DUF2065 family)